MSDPAKAAEQAGERAARAGERASAAKARAEAARERMLADRHDPKRAAASARAAQKSEDAEKARPGGLTNKPQIRKSSGRTISMLSETKEGAARARARADEEREREDHT